MKIETNSDRATLVEISEMVTNYVKGFNWVARDEIGSLSFFIEKPVRLSEVYGKSNGYDFWINDNNFPVRDHKVLAESDFEDLYHKITFSGGPKNILDYLGDKDPLLIVKLTGGESK